MSTASMVSPTRSGAPPHARSRSHGLVRILPLVPAIAMLAVFMLGPVIWSFYGSLTNTALTGPNALHPRFIGLDNYSNLISDPNFPKSVWLTIVFVFMSAIVGQNILGLFVASMLRRANPAVRAVVGTLIVAAWIMPEIVAAFAAYAFFSDGGTFTQLSAWVGLHSPNMLYDHPMAAVVIANIWRGTAFSMMVYTAALDDVPPDVIEAAEVDGASGFQRLVRITLPMIRRSISTNFMLTTLQTLSVFTLIWVMTSGGPGTDSSTLPVLAYQQAFKFSKIGYGTAIATVMLLVGAVFSIIYIRMLKPEVD